MDVEGENQRGPQDNGPNHIYFYFVWQEWDKSRVSFTVGWEEIEFDEEALANTTLSIELVVSRENYEA